MRSARTVAIAALLVASLATMAIVAADPTADPIRTEAPSSGDQAALQQPSDETTTRLGLDEPAESTYTTPGPDLGATIASHGDAARSEWVLHEAEYEWAVRSDAEREALLEDLHDRLLERQDVLQTREERAVSAVANGEASAAYLLRTMARNDREAARLTSHFERLSDLADDVEGTTITVRTPTDLLSLYQGPVRSNVFDAMSGAEPMDPTAVRASEAGAILATIDGGTFKREAVRFDNRDLSLPYDYEQSEANARLDELYPWVTGGDSEQQGTFRNTHPTIQLHRFVTIHKQGLLNTYLDGGTGEIFRENQELTLSSLPQVERGTWGNGELNVSVNASAGGELLVLNVTDAVTGVPVDGTITSDEQVIAELDDGRTWLVEPAGEYELIVETDAGSITLDELD
ncbi:DUF7096 domain-containing protein [Halovivax limisalsi]|uniref:DUF7096 domain-containing protein n=1 Tax=Halovivax limisalsi TaxID=1453760 RepID=UPI001FFD8B67|nr:hypothetical protein [Halovivax limisalsi]